MGRVARDLRLLRLFWSDELLAETRKSLIGKKRLTPDVAQRWVDRLPQNFPDGQVPIGEVFSSTDFSGLTSDPGDHHVCALVIASQARYLFTHDRGYLQDGLAQYGIEVTAPDTFLAATFDEQPRGMLEILELQATDWGGGRPTEELLDAIERAGASVFAGKARIALEA